MLFNIQIVFDIFLCVNRATSCECQVTTSRSDGKIPRMKRPMSEVPSKISTARSSAISNHIQVHKSPKRRCRKITPSSSSCSFIAVRKEGDYRALCSGSGPIGALKND